MWHRRFQGRPDAGALQACAGLALACTYSSSDEYEAELIRAQRNAGVYGPRRHRPLVLAAAAVIALAAVALFAAALAIDGPRAIRDPWRMGIDLQGKVALVTGGSRGIGRGIALELASAGCDLLLTARDEAALGEVAAAVRATGRRAEIHAADLRDEAEPQRLVELASRHFGRLDILINNAGASRRGDFFQQTEADWQAGFALKFFAQVRLCRAAWPLLKVAGGSVIAIGGIGARAPVADYMIGASVIGAQNAFMKALADLGKTDGVQVNSVHPGSVETDRFRGRLEKVMARTGLDRTAAIEHHRKELGITRFGQPQDIAGLVAFIVSPRGRWMHGTAVDMDGGQVDPLRMSRYD